MDFAKELDITRLPSLVYFENGKASIYTEDLEDEDTVLNWLITVRVYKFEENFQN